MACFNLVKDITETAWMEMHGSIKAPLLFITGINDLQESINKPCYLFADDITFFN